MADTSDSTTVGESTLITGNLRGDEDLTVLGRVVGSITLTQTLVVAEIGTVKAEIDVRNAVVSGVVVGNVTASESVLVTETGRLVGNINAPRVIIVAGARVRGTVDMGDMGAPRPTGPLPAQTLERRAKALARTSQTRSTLPARPTLPAAPQRPRPTTAPPTIATASTTPSAPTPTTAPTAAKPTPKPAAATKQAPKATPPAATGKNAPVPTRRIKKKVVVKRKG